MLLEGMGYACPFFVFYDNHTYLYLKIHVHDYKADPNGRKKSY